jgi:MbtH protein
VPDKISAEDYVDELTYKVVINHEEQYSIWPLDRDNPLGWQDAGVSGTKGECLDYIDKVWTDITPLSVRRSLQEHRERG